MNIHTFTASLARPAAIIAGWMALAVFQCPICPAAGEEKAQQEPVAMNLLRAAENEITAGTLAEAAAILDSIAEKELSDESRRRVQYLRGRIALAEKRWTAAENIFTRIVETSSVETDFLLAASYVGLADALAGQGLLKRSERFLRAILDRAPFPGIVEPVLSRLNDQGAFNDANPDDAELLAWAESRNPHLNAMANFYLAAAATRTLRRDRARELLESFESMKSTVPLSRDGELRVAWLWLLLREPDRARAVLDRLQTNPPTDHARHRVREDLRATYLRGWADYISGDFPSAIERFGVAAEKATDLGEEKTFAFNRGLAAMRASFQDPGSGLAEPVSAPASTDETGAPLSEAEHAVAGDLLLEHGLYLAAMNRPEAATTLLGFLKKHPGHSRLADAHLTLAEIFFLGIPPQPIKARAHLEAARAQPLAPRQAEQIDYVAIWVEASAREDDQVAALSQEFIEKWPQSSRVPEIHFMLGEVFSRRDYHGSAHQHFLKVSEDYPSSPYADAALFHAAKSARLTMLPDKVDKAIGMWGRLVDGGGPFALRAWIEQGLAKLELGKESDAIAVFDSILESDMNPEGDVRFSVLTSKGQALYNSASLHAAALEDAIDTFDLVIGDPEASSYWRNQASVRKARCLERQGDLDAALDVYGEVVRRGPSDSVSAPPEFDWFSRAGFAAVRLLEDKENWQAAVTVAEKLARSGGGRAQEATELANKLRLEHAVWENAPNVPPGRVFPRPAGLSPPLPPPRP